MALLSKKQQFLANVKIGDILIFDRRREYFQLGKSIGDPLVRYWLPDSNEFFLRPGDGDSTALVCGIHFADVPSFLSLVVLPDDGLLFGWVDGTTFASRTLNGRPVR